MIQPLSQTQRGKLNAFPRHILLPTDFSAVSHNAFLYGLNLAAASGAKITLLHVCYESPMDTRFVPQEFIDALRSEKTEKANGYFETYQQEAQRISSSKIEVETRIAYGYVVETISEIGAELMPDLILMGTMGDKGAGVKIMGSIAAHVIQQATVPVMVIPDGVSYRPFRHLLYATTFHSEDLPYIKTLSTFARDWEAQLSCVHIKTEQETWTRMDPDFFQQISDIETSKSDIGLYVSQYSDIVDGLSNFADQHQVDLIAMLTHRRFEIDRLFDESMTQKMSLYTQIPLLAFHEE